MTWTQALGKVQERVVQGEIPTSLLSACEEGCIGGSSAAWRVIAGLDHEGIPKKTTENLTTALKSLVF